MIEKRSEHKYEKYLSIFNGRSIGQFKDDRQIQSFYVKIVNITTIILHSEIIYPVISDAVIVNLEYYSQQPHNLVVRFY